MTLVGVAEPHAAAQPRSEKAATDQRARELFVKGDAAYAEGRYEEALSAFQEAYDLSGRPQLLFNISNALERLARYADAVAALEKYLASGKAKDRDVVQKRLANLKKRVEEQKKEQEKLTKEEEEKKRREEEERRRRASESGQALPPTTPEQPPPPPERSGPVLPWVILGTGAAVLAAGGVFAVLTLGARDDAKASCVGSAAGNLCDANARDALDREKTFGLVADIGIVSGVVLAAIGVTLLITDRPAEPSVRVVGRPGGGGVELGGRF